MRRLLLFERLRQEKQEVVAWHDTSSPCTTRSRLTRKLKEKLLVVVFKPKIDFGLILGRNKKLRGGVSEVRQRRRMIGGHQANGFLGKWCKLVFRRNDVSVKRKREAFVAKKYHSVTNGNIMFKRKSQFAFSPRNRIRGIV